MRPATLRGAVAAVVRRKHGIIVDLSHMGPKTTGGIMDYMEEKYPGVPFVFTHSLPAGFYKDEPEATSFTTASRCPCGRTTT